MMLRRRLGVAFLVLAMAPGALVATTVGAAESPVYTVRDVPVDVTGETAAQAREKALAEGHRKAFGRMLARLVPRDQLDRVPELPRERLVAMVRDFEVHDERTSAVRYLAELTFRFKPEAVRGFLRGRSIPFAETRSKPVVVLPVYGAAGDAVLWDEPNPWRQVWARRAEEAGLVPLLVPLGDLGDMQAIDARAALEGNQARLRAIAERYGGESVLVSQALVAGDPRVGNASLQVISGRFGVPGGERTMVDSLRQREDEELEAMLARAAQTVARTVEEAWKQANLLRFESRRTLAVTVPLAGLEEWLTINRRLQQVPLIGETALKRMTRRTAELEIAYYGDREQLELALAQSDLALEPAALADDGWRLRRAEASARRVREPAAIDVPPSEVAPRTPSPAGEEAAGASADDAEGGGQGAE